MVYLLRFHQPVGSGKKYVRYYLGHCRDNRLEQRLAEHRSGNGAKLVAAAIARGIDFDVVRTWPKATRTDERRLKRQHNHKRFDPEKRYHKDTKSPRITKKHEESLCLFVP